MKKLDPIPVTILTGFLGAGKTTLLNRILLEQHGEKIAVIENEFGEVGIDNELLLQSDEQIIEMNNGCICCTVRGDLVRILGNLAKKRRNGTLNFDRVIIETTGLADPAPVAQTFFVDEKIRASYELDAIITVVDAVHGMRHLDAHHEAQEQAGFADRILLSKTDLVPESVTNELISYLRQINPRAPIKPVHFGESEIADILDIHGFSLKDILSVEPDFLEDVTHVHDADIGSFVFRSEKPVNLDKLEAFLTVMGPDLLRYKGVLNVAGENCRIVFQGVHMLMGGTEGRPWEPDGKRESVLIFIGRDISPKAFEECLNICFA